VRRWGGWAGMGWAIRAATVRRVIPQLRDKGSVSRGWLGVQIQPVTAEIANVPSLKQPQGALVSEPVADGPAAKAGVLSGDVIASVDGKSVKDATALSKAISSAAPGTAVKLGVIRAGTEQTINVALGELPGANPAAGREQHDSDEPETMGRGNASDLGLELAPAGSITGAGEQGVVVLDINPAGLWAERGFSL